MFFPISETSSMLPFSSDCMGQASYDMAKTRTFSPKSWGSQFWGQQSWGSSSCVQVLFQASFSLGPCRPWKNTTSKLVERTWSSRGHSWCTDRPSFYKTITKGFNASQLGHSGLHFIPTYIQNPLLNLSSVKDRSHKSPVKGWDTSWSSNPKNFDN